MTPSSPSARSSAGTARPSSTIGSSQMSTRWAGEPRHQVLRPLEHEVPAQVGEAEQRRLVARRVGGAWGYAVTCRCNVGLLTGWGHAGQTGAASVEPRAGDRLGRRSFGDGLQRGDPGRLARGAPNLGARRHAAAVSTIRVSEDPLADQPSLLRIRDGSATRQAGSPARRSPTRVKVGAPSTLSTVEITSSTEWPTPVPTLSASNAPVSMAGQAPRRAPRRGRRRGCSRARRSRRASGSRARRRSAACRGRARRRSPAG